MNPNSPDPKKSDPSSSLAVPLSTFFKGALGSYLATYLALMGLLGATFFLARVNLGPLSVPISLFIAAVKVILVALYFMQLRSSSGVQRVFAVTGVFWLGILISLCLSDYLSRGWLPLPGVWP